MKDAARFVTVVNGGASPYWARIKSFWGSSIVGYLPGDEASGITAYDKSGNGRNGTLAGTNRPTFGAAGIGDGKTAINFGGVTTQYLAWSSTGASIDPLEGTFIVWMAGMTGTIWDDGTTDQVINIHTDANNYHHIYKRSSPIRELVIRQVAGGTSVFRVVPMRNPNPFRFAYTWSKSNNRMRAYINGKQDTADLGGIGTWAGAINASYPILGASSIGTDEFKGIMAHAILLNREATAAELAGEYRLFKNPKRIGVIGDSIAAYTTVTSFSWMLRDNWNSGNVWLYNHAVTGQSIMSHMDAQVTAAATDDADMIILQLGTNDTSATGMQAEVEENIVELRASNPRAVIYYMNVLPRWTDVGGGTPVDKSAIRAAIAAACAAQGVTCWDTFTSPWITAAQTLDGLHPNDAGHLAILNQILARI